MSETHTTHSDAPKILSWVLSVAVAKPQTGYIAASLAWVRILLQDSFVKTQSNPNPNGRWMPAGTPRSSWKFWKGFVQL